MMQFMNDPLTCLNLKQGFQTHLKNWQNYNFWSNFAYLEVFTCKLRTAEVFSNKLWPAENFFFGMRPFDQLEQCFSNRVSQHIFVSQVFSSVSPNYFKISFWAKICHLNINIMVIYLRNVSPKTCFWKLCRQPKKVENHWIRV